MEQKNINVGIKHEDAFFSDSVTIANNPMRFIFDFKQNSPRFDPINPNQEEQQTSIIIKHNVVMVDIQLAKMLHEMLGDRLKKYEEQFGKIKIDKPKPQAKEKKPYEADTVRPDYFG